MNQFIQLVRHQTDLFYSETYGQLLNIKHNVKVLLSSIYVLHHAAELSLSAILTRYHNHLLIHGILHKISTNIIY